MKQPTTPAFRNKIEEAQEMLLIMKQTNITPTEKGRTTLKKAREELCKLIDRIDEVLSQ